MNSPMGRNDFTDEEKALIRKFKLMKNMIVYLQRIPLFGKFCFYGCYCFAKGPKELLIDAGNGKPMDNADNACRHHLVIFYIFTFSATFHMKVEICKCIFYHYITLLTIQLIFLFLAMPQLCQNRLQ